MALFRERTTNTNDTSDISSAIALNATTSIKLSDSCTQCRIFFAVSNTSSQDIWLKLQAASVDNDKKGIFIPKKSYWEMSADNIYIGEISSIAESGTPNIYITDY